MKKLLYVMSLVALAFSACEKGDLIENTEYTKIEAGDPAYSYIRMINLTPGSPSINYNLNGLRVSGNGSTNGKEAGYVYLGAFPGSGASYVPGKPGTNEVSAQIVSSALQDPSLEVFKTSVNMTGGKYYTLFTTGTYNVETKKIGSSLLLEEVKPALDTSKVFIKVIHLGNGAGNVDFVHKTSGQKIASNLAFGKASDFVESTLPGQSAVYEIKDATTGTVLNSSAATTLTKGQAYTFIIRGVVGSTATPLGMNYFTTFNR